MFGAGNRGAQDAKQSNISSVIGMGMAGYGKHYVRTAPGIDIVVVPVPFTVVLEIVPPLKAA